MARTYTPVVSQMVLGSMRRRDSTHRRGAALAAAAVLLLVPAAVACGDGGGGSEKTPASTTQSSSSAAEPSATAPADPAAAEKEIRQNWVAFFDPSVPLKDKEAVLENGQRMRPVLEGFNGDKRGQDVSAKVDKVAFTSPTTADVTYTLSLKGATVLPGASGTAVEQDGTWKVSVKTLCALVQLNSNASRAPGC